MRSDDNMTGVLILEREPGWARSTLGDEFFDGHRVDLVSTVGELLAQAEEAQEDDAAHEVVVFDVEGIAFGYAVQAVVTLLVEDPSMRVILLVNSDEIEWRRVLCDLPQRDRVLVQTRPCPGFALEQAIRVMTATLATSSASAFQRRGVTAIHARQIAMVGQLAAGIAHEINTPMQYVSDSVFFLRDAFSTIDEKVRSQTAVPGEGASDVDFALANVPDALDRIEEGLLRVAYVVSAMREFAPAGSGDDLDAVDINQLVRTTVTVAAGAYRRVARVETDLGDIPQIVCCPVDLGSVFLNILVNAVQAIEVRQKGNEGLGLVSIATRLEDDRVVIAFTDDGCGIAEEAAARVFEPFFTTKPVGRGTGQGLAVARAIIEEKHRGRLSFESNAGKGTTFYVELPTAKLSAEALEIA